ncbi:endocuticle structural glycoprotein SgAbd-1-like [Pollicipes pollicipes]|uniref:endocuticle structural glycoprotein SgAbd-1-like n=1 Tax=Pollicipes pollicipes TaxID=41117 RepID=UPI0018851D54|nr:endocuticle structural glycoprotein SgAbd-1-like [Pollicipes pollicipes]XP_037069302.1 endocuticle structural glycoprotein SgAbd-1-like [Pollicipes pollicipes]
MKLIVAVAVLVVVAVADKPAPAAYPPPPPYGYPKPVVKILSSTDSRPEDQSYEFSYTSEDGIERSESGAPLPDSGYSEGGYSQQGSVKYLSPEGTPIELSFVANADGFVATGDHLPTPVPNPYDRL